MPTIALRLDPNLLENPDLDIRHALPDLLAERSDGNLVNDGYDYVGAAPYLIIFLKCSDTKEGATCVLDMIENTRVLGIDLRGSVVAAIDCGHGFEITYPSGFRGTFPV